MVVEVREAQYFVAVAEELHFGRAAERLHISQPPLSQAIKGLERHLGVTLLDRSTRHVALTAAGVAFLDACRELVGAATTAGSVARQAAEGQVGELRVGAVTSAFNDPLPRALELFRRGHPRVDVRVEEVDTHVAVQALRRHELDVALVRQLASPPDCHRVTLQKDHFVLAVPGWWRIGSEEPTELLSAAGLPWIWLPRSISPDYHDQVVACCREAGFAPEAHHVARSITSQLAMVACGLGVALVPESAARAPGSPDAEAVRFRRLRRSTTIELAAVWRSNAGALVVAFIKSVQAAIAAGAR